MPLIIDIRKEVGVLEIFLQIVRAAIVLGGHEARLDEVGPGVASQERLRAPAEPVCSAALLELADAIVLAAEGDEAAHRRLVAALDIAAEELAALREADGVDGGRGREDGVRCEVVADLGDLQGEVAQEGGPAVVGGVVVEADVVD